MVEKVAIRYSIISVLGLLALMVYNIWSPGNMGFITPGTGVTDPSELKLFLTWVVIGGLGSGFMWGLHGVLTYLSSKENE